MYEDERRQRGKTPIFFQTELIDEPFPEELSLGEDVIQDIWKSYTIRQNGFWETDGSDGREGKVGVRECGIAAEKQENEWIEVEDK